MMRDPANRGLMMRIWEIVGLWPHISDPVLEHRLEEFILHATCDQLFDMQEVIFDEATPYLTEDERVCEALRTLERKSVGLVVDNVYDSTVTVGEMCFEIERGVIGDIPVISIKSRRDYADAILSRRDPLTMFLKGRIKISRLLTLARWVLPHYSLLLDGSLLDKYLGYQDEVEKVLDENLRKLGY